MAINNPYIPGDPYSYDLKWLVAKVKEILQQLGTLDEAIEKKIFEGFLEHSIVQFHNVPDMLAADMKDGSIVLTLGYHEAGDLGAMFYLIKDFNPGQCALDYFLTMGNNTQIAIPVVVTPYVTPEMFGAYGDGTADDTDAMQLAADTGSIIARKEYRITKEVTIPEGHSVTGGRFVIVNAEGTSSYEYPGIFKMSDNTKIAGAVFNGSGSRTDNVIENRSVIRVEDVENVSVKDCEFYDVSSGSVIRVKNSDHVTVDGNYINGYSFCGISFVHCSNIEVNDNKLEGLTGTYVNTYPITLSGREGAYTITENAICSRNVIICPFPHWEAIDAHGGKNFVISDNVIKGSQIGIAVMETANTAELVNNIVISGNMIELSTDKNYGNVGMNFCIVVSGTNIDIANNVMVNGGVACDGYGDTFAMTITGTSLRVSDNVIDNPNGGVIDIRGGYDIMINDNQVKGWHWDTPNGHYPYFVRAENGTKYGRIIVKNNLIEAFTDAYLGSVGSHFTDEDGYIKVDGNIMDTGHYEFSNASQVIQNPRVGYPAAAGKQGDIVFALNPAVGSPIGYICTASYTNGTGGHWQALPNL